MLVLTPAYVASTIQADPGYYVVATDPARCEQPFPTKSALEPLQTAAMASDGTVALIEERVPPSCDAIRLVIIRPNGTKLRIRLPELAYNRGDKGLGGISQLRLGKEGAPFVTAAVHFSGAFSGVREAAFRWEGDRWTSLDRFVEGPGTPDNVSIGAVESAGRFGVYADYDDANRIDYSLIQKDPSYDGDVSAIVSNGQIMQLGLGTVTGVVGSWSCGFQSGYQRTRPTLAVRWLGPRVFPLGRGVAFGINASGVAVGDDRPEWTASGVPTIWNGSGLVRVSSATGSLYGVNESEAVGTIGGRAIAVAMSDPQHPHILDDLVAGYGRKFVAAYAVSKNGTILARGIVSGKSQLSLLHRTVHL